MITLLDFAKIYVLPILIKERVKCRGKYVGRLRTGESGHGPSGVRTTDSEDVDFDAMAKLDLLTAMMPGRAHWVRLKNRRKYQMDDGRIDKVRMYTKAVKVTIENDRVARETDPDNRMYAYLDVLDRFVDDILCKIGGHDELTFNEPILKTLYKKESMRGDGTREVIYRPLSIYNDLRDKVILGVTSKYIANKFNWYLHENILSYRSARKFHGEEKPRVTDFNDGIKIIKEYREANEGKDFFVADCDIKKFYDTINHDVVRGCFDRMLRASKLSETGREQVMRVLDAYLRSYNFYEQVYEKSQAENFWNGIRSRRRRSNVPEVYKIDWVKEREFADCYGSKEAFESVRNKIGVPQGGSLSIMIADVVLNDVDKGIVNPLPFPDDDKEKLFVRFCDDMVLMHTERAECERLIGAYCTALKEHKLIYHDFTNVSDVKKGESLCADFWDVKSHNTFRWGPGEGDASEWIGFLGYEMRYDGAVRLRHSNVEKVCQKIEKQYFSSVRAMAKPETDIQKLVERMDSGQEGLPKALLFYKGLSDNPHLQAQLIRLDQRRKFFVRRASCKALSAKCTEDEEDRKELRKSIRQNIRGCKGYRALFTDGNKPE